MEQGQAGYGMVSYRIRSGGGKMSSSPESPEQAKIPLNPTPTLSSSSPFLSPSLGLVPPLSNKTRSVGNKTQYVCLPQSVE